MDGIGKKGIERQGDRIGRVVLFYSCDKGARMCVSEEATWEAQGGVEGQSQRNDLWRGELDRGLQKRRSRT